MLKAKKRHKCIWEVQFSHLFLRCWSKQPQPWKSQPQLFEKSCVVVGSSKLSEVKPVFAAGAIKVTFLHVSMWRLIGASLSWTFLSLTCSLTDSFTLFSLNNLFFPQLDEFLHEKKKLNIIFWTEVASLLLSLPLHLLSPLPLKALLPPLSTFTRNVQTNFIYSRISSSVSVSCVFFRSSLSNRAAGAPGCRSSQWWSPWRPPSSTPTSPRAAPPRTQNTSEHTHGAPWGERHCFTCIKSNCT